MRKANNTAFIKLCILVTLLFNQSISSDEISLRTDYWCPYTCEDSVSQRGVLIDIVEHIFEQKGHTLNYRIIPWKRAIAMTRKGVFNGIIGSFYEDAPDFIFHKEALAYSVNVFFVLDGSNWKYSGLESLNDVKFGIVLGYSYGVEIDKYIQNHGKQRVYVASGDTPISDLVRLLKLNRIDAVLENRWVMKHYLKKINMSNEIIEAGISSFDPVYVAFSPVKPLSHQYASEIDNVLIEMKKDGSWLRILKDYDLLPNQEPK